MVVILFHNNDDILLQKYQKDFIFLNQSSLNILYAHYPVRCTISKEELSQSELKQIIKTIKSIAMNEVAWDEESQTLNCHISIFYNDGNTKTFSFPLIESLNKQKKIAENQLQFPAISIFPKSIKTFRLGNEVSLDSNSTSISAAVWH